MCRIFGEIFCLFLVEDDPKHSKKWENQNYNGHFANMAAIKRAANTEKG